MVNATPQLLYNWERPNTHCIGGWIGPRVSLNTTNYIKYEREYINCLIGTEIMFLSWCITGMVFIRTVVKIFKVSNIDMVSMMIKLESSLLACSGHNVTAQPNMSAETSPSARNDLFEIPYNEEITHLITHFTIISITFILPILTIFSTIIDKHKHTHFFTFKTVLV